MCMTQFLSENKSDLCRIFSEIYSGREIELVLNPKLTQEEFDQSCCIDAVVILKYNDKIVEFPVSNQNKLIEDDLNIAEELYSIVLCEKAVKEGLLTRNGLKYAPTKDYKPSILHDRCSKYIVVNKARKSSKNKHAHL